MKEVKRGDLIVNLYDNEIFKVDEVGVKNKFPYVCTKKCHKFNRYSECFELVKSETNQWTSRLFCLCDIDKATEREEFLYTLGIIKKRGEDE